MVRLTKFIVAIFLLISFYQGFAQKMNKKEAASLYAKQGIALCDSEKPNEAIVALKEALKLDPGNIEYTYELAYAYNLKKDYTRVLQIMEKLIQRKGAFGKMYHLLGNTYDNLSQPAKAIETYQLGIKLFPNTGGLYLEIGNSFLKNKNYLDAARYYEKGIIMDPVYPANYYRVTKLFMSSSEKIWGMLYGEIFVLLESNTKRTAEISKLIYDTYKKQVSISADGVCTVVFGNIILPDINAPKDTGVNTLPFLKKVYEPLMRESFSTEKAVDINSLSRARTKFIEMYFKTDAWQKYPNPLFDYAYKVLKAGHIDAYNHWLLANGNPDDFQAWQTANSEEYQKFFTWFVGNPIALDAKYKFYREQY